MSARSTAQAARPVPTATTPKKKYKPKPAKRMGHLTAQEHTLVKNIMAEVPDVNEKALARVLRRSTAATRKLVEEVRQDFAEAAKDYLTAHRSAVMSAVANTDDAKSLDAGIRGAQWALEHISFEGSRVVDAANQKADTGTKIIIGIGLKLGGQSETGGVVDAVEAEIAENPSKNAD